MQQRYQYSGQLQHPGVQQQQLRQRASQQQFHQPGQQIIHSAQQVRASVRMINSNHNMPYSAETYSHPIRQPHVPIQQPYHPINPPMNQGQHQPNQMQAHQSLQSQLYANTSLHQQQQSQHPMQQQQFRPQQPDNAFNPTATTTTLQQLEATGKRIFQQQGNQKQQQQQQERQRQKQYQLSNIPTDFFLSPNSQQALKKNDNLIIVQKQLKKNQMTAFVLDTNSDASPSIVPLQAPQDARNPTSTHLSQLLDEPLASKRQACVVLVPLDYEAYDETIKGFATLVMHKLRFLCKGTHGYIHIKKLLLFFLSGNKGLDWFCQELGLNVQETDLKQHFRHFRLALFYRDLTLADIHPSFENIDCEFQSVLDPNYEPDNDTFLKNIITLSVRKGREIIYSNIIQLFCWNMTILEFCAALNIEPNTIHEPFIRFLNARERNQEVMEGRLKNFLLRLKTPTPVRLESQAPVTNKGIGGLTLNPPPEHPAPAPSAAGVVIPGRYVASSLDSKATSTVDSPVSGVAERQIRPTLTIDEAVEQSVGSGAEALRVHYQQVRSTDESSEAAGQYLEVPGALATESRRSSGLQTPPLEDLGEFMSGVSPAASFEKKGKSVFSVIKIPC